VRTLSRSIAALVAVLACAALLVSSPTVVAQEATPCPPLTEEEGIAWGTAYINAVNSNDAAQVAALYTPEAIHHWGIGIDSEGADEINTSFETFFGAFPGIHLTADQIWVAGDSVIIRWIAIGIQEGDFMGVPGSRVTTTWTGINIFQLDCGLVVESWSETDHFSRLEQMGLIPIAPEAEATPAG
jgi:predicted ester cyclase